MAKARAGNLLRGHIALHVKKSMDAGYQAESSAGLISLMVFSQ